MMKPAYEKCCGEYYSLQWVVIYGSNQRQINFSFASESGRVGNKCTKVMIILNISKKVYC
jgi:hypothetical protein